ncbi:MAG TPA: hypothetical protein VFD66_14225 [Verrucomicrobiae bacterium]|nr:hypothetical protein [Verrucomicrobiae bacterium]
MKTLRTSAIVAAMAFGVLLAPRISQAQTNAPTGNVQVAVTDLTNRVWDLDRVINGVGFSVTNKNDATVDVDYALNLIQTGSGSLKTAGDTNETTVHLTINGTNAPDFTGKFHASGSITSNKGKGHGTFTSTVTGLALIVKPRHVTATESIVFSFDNIANTTTLTKRDSASASGLGSIRGDPQVTIGTLTTEFPGDGSWTLALVGLTTSGKNITGTAATVTLSTGQVFNFKVKGLFKTTDSTSRLLLASSDTASRGSSLTVTMAGNTVMGIKGRITGQSVNVSF